MRETAGELAIGVAQIGRTALLGTTSLFALLGAASAGGDGVTAARIVLVVVAATAFHLAVYAWNDVADLPLDRNEPRRAASPLVRGLVGSTTVAVAGAASACAALVLAAVSGTTALVAMALALALLLAYDVLGKRLAWSPVTDILQGLGWAALVVYGAAATDAPTRATAWIAVYVLLLIVLVNGLHGGVRDLANDRRGGARTTALLLGARPLPGGGVAVGRQLTAYAVSVQLLMGATLVAAGVDLGGPQVGIVAASGGIGSGGCLALLVYGIAAASVPARSWAAALAHIICVSLLPIVLVLDNLDPSLAVALVVLFAIPWMFVGGPLRRGLRSAAGATR